jgi:hypothetical protein
VDACIVDFNQMGSDLPEENVLRHSRHAQI